MMLECNLFVVEFMRLSILLTTLTHCLLFSLGFALPAVAQPLGGESAVVAAQKKLSECFAGRLNTKDKTVLARWVFGAIASNPNLKDISIITIAQAADLNKQAGALFGDLLTDRCNSEAVHANELSENAVAQSFEVLGSIAVEQLIDNESFNEYLAGLITNIDQDDMEKIMKVFSPAH